MRRRKGFAFCCAGMLAVSLTLTGCGTDQDAEALKQGKKILKELEQKDVAAVEKKMKELEEAERIKNSALDTRTPDEKFKNAVILGDSITEGLKEYEVLSPEKVIATIGISLPDTKEDVQKAIGLRPQYVFLAYGENDVEGTNGDTGLFKEQYASVVDQLKEALPEAEIFINEILPVQQKVIDETPVYKSLSQYNETIRELCEEKGITAIDNSSLAAEELYEPDGIHMGPKYYPAWVSHMAEVAGI